MKKKVLFFIVFIILILFCFPQKVFAEENNPQIIRLQLHWDHQFQFAGYYAADWMGFYKEEGLKVNIISALKSDGTILSSTKEVSEGRADFGIGAADILIANDNGADLRVTAVILQQSAARYYLKEETPFSHISDLTKLRVARKVNDLIDIELQAMLLNEGIDPKTVKAYPHQAGMDHLISDKVQVMPGYALSAPFFAKEQGIAIKEINPLNYGVDFYGDSLFVSGALADENPELVARFVMASLKGWEYALNNPDEIAARISKELKITQKNDDFYGFNLYQAKTMKELTEYPIVGIGRINPYRWEKMHGFLKQIGLVKNDININKFIFDPVKLQVEKDKKIKDILFRGSVGLFGLVALILLWVYFLKKAARLRVREIKDKERLLIESQRAEEALRESEEKYRTLFNTSIEGILITEISTQKIKYANPAICQMLGYTEKELTAMNVAEIHIKEDLQVGLPALKNQINIRATETLLLRKDRTNFYAEINGVIITIGGQKYGAGFFRDITERKNKESEIIYIGYHDKLTGLYNRRFVEEEIIRLDTKRQLPLSIIMGDLNSLKLTNDAFGHNVGDTILKETATLLKKICRSEDILARWGGDEFVSLLPKTSGTDAEEVVQRIKKECANLNIQKIPLSLSIGIATKTETEQDIELIITEAESNMYKNKLVEKESVASSIIFALEQTLFEKSSETMEHALRIKDNSIKLGKSVNLASNQLDELYLLASLHDIGKVAIPESILLKEGRPTEEEWAVIKRHPEIGFNIAQSSPQIVHIAKFILACHENWDGSGYPQGLVGDAIPIVSRIIFICDAYDVMISERRYKKAMGKDDAIKELERCAGTQFDPVLVDKFIEIIST